MVDAINMTSAAIADQPLSGAVHWTVSLLVGSLARTVAVIAVALFGVSMLQGRLSRRRGGVLILGCFVLFAAPLIGQGLLGGLGAAMSGDGAFGEAVPSYRPSKPMPSVYDPYDGAAIPNQGENNFLN